MTTELYCQKKDNVLNRFINIIIHGRKVVSENGYIIGDIAGIKMLEIFV